MEELYVLHKGTQDQLDPHGYFCEIDRQELNYKSPTKRSFLNECIRQIYIMNGNTMPMISIPVEYNKTVIWSKLNRLIKPAKISKHQTLVQRVKRRLFWEPKKRQRKSQSPQFNNSKLSECINFKVSRHVLGIRKIPRNYLDQASENIQNSMQRQKLKRKLIDQKDNPELKKSPVNFNSNNEGAFQVSQQVVSNVCRYHSNMARRHHPQKERSVEEQTKRERNTEACRLSRRAKKLEEMLIEQQYYERFMANEKVLEASIRSILYMKALMGLMLNQHDERNLYI